ncbi:MAG: hypothetical protein ABIK36_16255 [Pseudomonadota bacterium]
MLNGKETAALMLAAGWTAAAFATSLNATIRGELARPSNKAEPEEITVEQAERFLAKGEGINGDTADVLERWAERRMGLSGASGKVFSKPQEMQTLSMVSPPVIIADDVALSQDNADIAFRDETNQRARKKMLADGITHSA